MLIVHTFFPSHKMAESTLNYLKSLGDNGPCQGVVQGGTTTKECLSEMARFSIDEYRQMKVIVVGAGLTGVAAAIRCVVAFFLVFTFIKYSSMALT